MNRLTLLAAALVAVASAHAESAMVADRIVWPADGRGVEVDISGAPLEQVLARLSAQTGWEVRVEPGVQLTVSAKFSGKTSGEALARLLGGLNYALDPWGDGPARLLIFRSSRSAATQPILPSQITRPTPASLTSLRGQDGRSYFFEVTGATVGSVWGVNPYTDDSQLAAAAVHAGVLRAGETGIVKVTLLPGQPSYSGSSSNGVQTGAWPAYEGSYRVAAVGAR